MVGVIQILVNIWASAPKISTSFRAIAVTLAMAEQSVTSVSVPL